MSQYMSSLDVGAKTRGGVTWRQDNTLDIEVSQTIQGGGGREPLIMEVEAQALLERA